MKEARERSLKVFLDHHKTAGLTAQACVIKNSEKGLQGYLGLSFQTLGLNPMKQTLVLPVKILPDDLDTFRASPWMTQKPSSLVQRIVQSLKVSKDAWISLGPLEEIYVGSTKDPEVFQLQWFPRSSRTRVLTESLTNGKFLESEESLSRMSGDEHYRGPLFETRLTFETMSLEEDLLKIFQALQEFKPIDHDSDATESESESDLSDSDESETDSETDSKNS